jgi:hypothetical protein
MFSTWCPDLSLSFDAHFFKFIRRERLGADKQAGGGRGPRGGGGRAGDSTGWRTGDTTLTILCILFTGGGRAETPNPDHDHIYKIFLLICSICY